MKKLDAMAAIHEVRDMRPGYKESKRQKNGVKGGRTPPVIFYPTVCLKDSHLDIKRTISRQKCDNLAVLRLSLSMSL